MTNAKYQVLDLTIDNEQKIEGIFQILHQVKPHWKHDDVTIQPLRGGFMDKLFACFLTSDENKSDGLVIRINNPRTLSQGADPQVGTKC